MPNGAAARCAQIWVGDILSTIDDRHVTSIAEAKQLILGDEGTYVTLGLQRPSVGEFTLRIARGTTGTTTSASPSASSGSKAPAPGDYGSWSVKELKQALSEAGISHAWANEKGDLVLLATENKVPPPGTPRRSSQSGSGRSGADLARSCGKSIGTDIHCVQGVREGSLGGAAFGVAGALLVSARHRSRRVTKITTRSWG